MNVVLVDDSITLRTLAAWALAGAGFGVIEAGDGLEALEKLETATDVALIVCDVNMPRMGGMEFIEKLAGGKRVAVPIIMLTTEGHPDMIRRARACGVSAWMVKPFKPELLVAAVRKLTRAHAA